MLVQAPTLYDCWVGLNDAFMRSDDAQGMLIPSRDFSRVIWPVRLHATQGFGVSTNIFPPFFKYENRTKLLAKRYIDPELWQEGVDRLKAREKRMQPRNPLSFSIQFHRRATSERKVPAGGGCLQHMTLVWCNSRWSIMAYLRASEITARLVADVAFLSWAIDQIKNEVRLKHWSDDNLEIVLDIGLASQMKYLYPLFVLYTKGEHELFKQMFVNPEDPTLNQWTRVVVKHFWEVVLHPEKITWAQRRKWAQRLIWETPNIDWSLAEKHWLTFWEENHANLQSISGSPR